MPVFGLLRIKNEARWIVDVLNAALPLCERVFVLDDHSTDGTPELCESLDRVTVFRSAFAGLDESRDKTFILQQAYQFVPPLYGGGAANSPYWALAIDGDELLDPAGPDAILATLKLATMHAFKLPVKYLWNSDLSRFSSRRQARVDGVYRNFARPSLFRLFNRQHTFLATPWGGNLHCSSIPQQLLHGACISITNAPLWHLGYNDRADRIRKHAWYNRVDPNNFGEDSYRHCIQGDVPEVPAGARLRHAGPLQLEVTEA